MRITNESALTVGEVLAQRVRYLRKVRGMTQSDLAEWLEITQTGVARIESGQRSVTVDELVMLAVALRTSPIYLMTPDDPEEEVTVFEDTITASHLRDWIRGFDRLPEVDEAEFADAMPFDDRVFLADHNVRTMISVTQAQARAMRDGDPESFRTLEQIRSGLVLQSLAADSPPDDEPPRSKRVPGSLRDAASTRTRQH